MLKPKLAAQIKKIVTEGGVIAYPTEAVYGLGCDPTNQQAVERILQLKQRPEAKGFILIASCWEQVADWLLPIAPERLAEIRKTWPGPYTWVFPTKPQTPTWLKGEHDSLAVRITAHPIAAELCEILGHALVSTSANIHQQPAARTANEIQQYFPSGIDLIIDEPVGTLDKPTTIKDALTGKVLR